MPHAPGSSVRPSRSELQPAGLIEVDDGSLTSRAPAEAHARKSKLTLLRLPVRDQGLGLLVAGEQDLGGLAQHLPEAGRPGAGCRDQRLAFAPAPGGEHGLDAIGSELEAGHLDALDDARSGRARPLGQVPHRLHGVGPASPTLVEDGLDRRLPVGPRPGQVLAAAIRPNDQLRLVPSALVLLTDRHQILDLGLGDRGEVADLPEAVAVRVRLEHLDRLPDEVGDRRGAVVVANDSTGDARGAGADPMLLEDQHVGAALGQAPGRRQAVDAAADDDVACASQLHGYGLLETGCRSPVSKRSKRKGWRREECSPWSSRAISRPTAIIL